MDQIKTNKNHIRKLKELEDGLNPTVLAKQVVIRGENKRIFTDYVLKIREKILSHSKVEEEFLKTYIFSGWKLRRFREIERNLLDKQQKPSEDELDAFEGSWRNNRKRRVRNLSKIKITDEIKENNLTQEKLKKEMSKALRQLREEQKLTQFTLVK
jgi:hypothetical protein